MIYGNCWLFSKLVFLKNKCFSDGANSLSLFLSYQSRTRMEMLRQSPCNTTGTHQPEPEVTDPQPRWSPTMDQWQIAQSRTNTWNLAPIWTVVLASCTVGRVFMCAIHVGHGQFKKKTTELKTSLYVYVYTWKQNT